MAAASGGQHPHHCPPLALYLHMGGSKHEVVHQWIGRGVGALGAQAQASPPRLLPLLLYYWSLCPRPYLDLDCFDANSCLFSLQARALRGLATCVPAKWKRAHCVLEGGWKKFSEMPKLGVALPACVKQNMRTLRIHPIYMLVDGSGVLMLQTACKLEIRMQQVSQARPCQHA
eukprot:scaffold302325_cov19-Tisochrysis_lutea.AAC.1